MQGGARRARARRCIRSLPRSCQLRPLPKARARLGPSPHPGPPLTLCCARPLCPLQGDLSKLRLEGRLPAPDVVVVDPARPGLSPSVISYLRACGARRLVYVSCNASTQARDIKQLCAPVGAGAGSSGGSGKRSSGKKRGGGGGTRGGGSGGGEAEQQYRLRWVQAVDLYPQTWHVETVAVLDAVR